MESKSLFTRMLMSILMLIGFYTLAFVVILALIITPIILSYGGSIGIAAFCFVTFYLGVIVIIFSIIPRRMKIKGRGVRLLREEQPLLFNEIEDIASSLGQNVPDDVFVNFELNASVTQTSGFFGFKSKRIMIIGLPLLQALTISKFRAVIAHEFGHYYSGDTKLLPILHQVNSVIGRTIKNLGIYNSRLLIPFAAYANLVLRITNKTSRLQEYIADRIAAKISGYKNLEDALKIVESYHFALVSYKDFINHLLKSFYYTELSYGFGEFLKYPKIRALIPEMLNRSMEDKIINCKYDTHPPLCKRIEAIQGITSNELNNDTLAISLISDIKKVEEGVLKNEVETGQFKEFRYVLWDELLVKALIPIWMKVFEQYANSIKNITFKELADFKNMNFRNDFITRLAECHGKELYEKEAISLSKHTLGVFITLALLNEDWELEIYPGSDVIFKTQSMEIKPFEFYDQITGNSLS
ncbi:MAG: M48 family metallopeptidase, partial [Bacillota bacterium]|nr:M48 family metallopeptidase [Bacillota bacterium]